MSSASVTRGLCHGLMVVVMKGIVSIDPPDVTMDPDQLTYRTRCTLEVQAKMGVCFGILSRGIPLHYERLKILAIFSHFYMFHSHHVPVTELTQNLDIKPALQGSIGYACGPVLMIPPLLG
jgi:hypothetical protein